MAGETQQRILSALAIFSVALICVLQGGWLFAALMTGFIVLASQEGLRLCEQAGYPLSAFWFRLGCAGICLSAFCQSIALFVTMFAVSWLAAMWLNFRAENLSLRERLARISSHGLMLLWIPSAMSAAIVLRLQPGGLLPFFFVLAICIASDSGAYFCGRAWGKTKLAPAVSPGKTIEGALGGALVAAITAAAFGFFFSAHSLSWIVLIGLGLAMAGLVGDLVESLLKRCAGVKDSGSFLPGHGGILDRFDSYLFTYPLLLALFLGHCFELSAFG